MTRSQKLLAVLLVLTTVPVAGAQSSDAGKGRSTYDRIWAFRELFRDDSNPIIQRVALSGRYQQDYVKLHEGDHDMGEWNVRRMRVGPRITFLRDFTFHVEADLNPQEHNPFYQRVTDFYVQWSPTPRLVTTVGKHGVPFTMDGSTSSKELLTIDRSDLSNNLWFPQEYIPGVSISGKASSWVYRTGAFSAGEATREFGRFNGSWFWLGSVGYDFSRKLQAREALLSVNYVLQPSNAHNTFSRQLHDVGSVNFKFARTRWGARGDISAASGNAGQSSLWGLMAMPFYNVTPAFQLVGRYTFMNSAHPNGLRLATYENRFTSGRGDRYNEVYLGANYYFYGHNLKVQSGLQFGHMRDLAGDGGEYSGVSWVSGLRIGW